MDTIRLGGTEEQKKKYLTEACAGSIISFATTEPEAGSDVASMKTTAIKEETPGFSTAPSTTSPMA